MVGADPRVPNTAPKKPGLAPGRPTGENRIRIEDLILGPFISWLGLKITRLPAPAPSSVL